MSNNSKEKPARPPKPRKASGEVLPSSKSPNFKQKHVLNKNKQHQRNSVADDSPLKDVINEIAKNILVSKSLKETKSTPDLRSYEMNQIRPSEVAPPRKIPPPRPLLSPPAAGQDQPHFLTPQPLRKKPSSPPLKPQNLIQELSSPVAPPKVKKKQPKAPPVVRDLTKQHPRPPSQQTRPSLQQTRPSSQQIRPLSQQLSCSSNEDDTIPWYASSEDMKKMRKKAISVDSGITFRPSFTIIDLKQESIYESPLYETPMIPASPQNNNEEEDCDRVYATPDYSQMNDNEYTFNDGYVTLSSSKIKKLDEDSGYMEPTPPSPSVRMKHKESPNDKNGYAELGAQTAFEYSVYTSLNKSSLLANQSVKPGTVGVDTSPTSTPTGYAALNTVTLIATESIYQDLEIDGNSNEIIYQNKYY